MSRALAPIILALTLLCACSGAERRVGRESESVERVVHARVQPRPGAPVAEFDMPVHRVPVDPPLVPASEVALADDEIVLGLVRDGRAAAFPIRTLSAFEVLNSSVAGHPIAPTW